MPRFLAASALLLVAASCDASRSAVAPTPTPPPMPGALPGAVATRPLAPHAYRLTVEGLPAPGHTSSARKGPRVVGVPDTARLAVPPGFVVQVFADGLDRPRTMRLTPEGDVLVAESRAHRLTLLRDANRDGVAEARTAVATQSSNLNNPFGLAFVGTSLYVGSEDRLTRHAWNGGQPLAGVGEKISDLQSGHTTVGGGHWTRDVLPMPGGQGLYVSVGSRSNVDTTREAGRATVLTIGLNGENLRTYASGLRNAVALALHPATNELYTVVNERDGLGDDLVPDYATRVAPGRFYGWPYAYLAPALLDPRRMTNGRSERPDLASQTTTPDVLLEAHAAALGLAFQPHAAMPAKYRTGLFVAMHGSWNRHRAAGYKLVYLPFGPDQRPTGAYEDFLTGFVLDADGPTTWGRPVSLLALPDGSLLMSEDGNGRIYRISYRGQ